MVVFVGVLYLFPEDLFSMLGKARHDGFMGHVELRKREEPMRARSHSSMEGRQATTEKRARRIRAGGKV